MNTTQTFALGRGGAIAAWGLFVGTTIVLVGADDGAALDWRKS